jgi:hypothetical protein
MDFFDHNLATLHLHNLYLFSSKEVVITEYRERTCVIRLNQNLNLFESFYVNQQGGYL